MFGMNPREAAGAPQRLIGLASRGRWRSVRICNSAGGGRPRRRLRQAPDDRCIFQLSELRLKAMCGLLLPVHLHFLAQLRSAPAEWWVYQ